MGEEALDEGSNDCDWPCCEAVDQRLRVKCVLISDLRSGSSLCARDGRLQLTCHVE